MTEASATDVKFRFDNLRHDFCLEETEDNWEKISKAIQAFTLVAEKGGYESAPTEVVNAIRNFHRPITNAMNSERTRLCGTALDMVTSVANGLGHDFDPLMPLFMPTLLNVCGRTNKVVINRARGAILSIIESTQLASILSFFVQNIKDKGATLRLIVAEGTLACLNSCNPPDLEKEARARDIETIIRASARDANPEVRKVSRKIFESYKILLPSRVESFTAPLSPTMKKYLDIKPTTTKKCLTSSKSTSNLRDHSKVPDLNPTTTEARGHLRTASASTIAVTNAIQSKNLAAKLTRIVRIEQPPGPRTQNPATTSRTNSEFQKGNPLRLASSTSTTTGTASGPIRTVSHNTESKSAAPPVRNHPNAASRFAAIIPTTLSTNSTTAAPRRLQVTSDTKSSAVQQPSTTSGARRVPMPPPAPHKEQGGEKKPPSRVGSSASTTEAGKASSASVPRPPAPVKKAATSTIAVRKATTKPPVPKFRPTSNSHSTGSAPAPNAPTSLTRTDTNATKPLMINKGKPIWGRAAAPSTKAAPAAAQKAPMKSVVRKPSSLISKTVTTRMTQDSASAKRPVTPAMVALPPSPARSEPEADRDEQKEVEERSTNLMVKDVVLQDMLPEHSSAPQQLEVNIIADDDDADRTVHYDTQTHTSVSVSPADSRLSTPTSEGSGPVTQVDNSEKALIHNPHLLGEDQAIPHTPESNLLSKPHDAASPLFSGKTPISALLSSIERGFYYSPTTPLSPADSYLPGPNGTISYRHETHAPRVEGPMRPFNHALHAMNPGQNIFGKTGIVQHADGADVLIEHV